MKQIEQTLTSVEVAEMVEKPHNDLLKDIRRYIEQLDEGKISRTDFFAESRYTDKSNRKKPCYLVTKKGCEFIAHKLTGAKGTQFTAKYINRFHDMEKRLAKPLTAIEQLQIQAQAVLEVNEKVDHVRKELEEFKQDLPVLGIEEDRITGAVKKAGIAVLGGKESNAYKDKSLRGKIYSDIYRELKRQFGVSTYKAIKRNQCETAVSMIAAYEPPMVLAEQIKDSNAQINMEV